MALKKLFFFPVRLLTETGIPPTYCARSSGTPSNRVPDMRRKTTLKFIFGGYGMKFRPLHDRVLVQREESEEKTAGGIIIPDTAKEKPMQGKVISVGSGARDEQGKVTPLDVKEGDIILFGKWSGTEIKLDGTDYLIMKESDIMGIIG